MEDNASYKSADSSTGRSIACRESKSISGVSDYASKSITLPLTQLKIVQYNQPANGSWLITSENGTISRAQCWCLLLADWAICRGHSQVSPGEWKIILLCPCITSIPATMAFLFMSLLGDYSGGWKNKLTGIHRLGYPIHLNTKILLY